MAGLCSAIDINQAQHWQRYLPNIDQTSYSPQHHPVPQPNGWHKVLTPIARSMGQTGPRWALCWPHEPCYLGRYSEKTQCAMYIWQYKRHKCQVSLHFSLHKVYSYYDTSQYSPKYSQYILHISTLKARYAVWSMFYLINSLRLRQNGHNFTDEMHFLEENVWILIEISLKFVGKCQINNISVLVQIMAWHWPGDKPLSEWMKLILLTYICMTRPQWVNCSAACNIV